MAHPKHDQVRQRYQRRCGYCGVSEIDTGGQRTIDHYRPVSAGGDEADDNLVYACFRCNTYKGDFFPDANDATANRRVLHPFRDPVALHLRENQATGFLEPQTEAGRFHTALLRLNRQELMEHRLARVLLQLLVVTHEALKQENEVLRRRLTHLEAYLRQGEGYLEDETEPEEG